METIKVLYGGSFNPPTIAHYKIAKYITDNYHVTDFVFLPTGNVYNKSTLISSNYRYEMLELLALKITNGRVSDLEMNDSVYHGTSYALKHFPNYYFVIGADNLEGITTWIDFPNVVKNNHFLVIKRTGYDIDKILSRKSLTCYRDSFIVLDIENINVSSTMFRETKDKRLVLEEVYDYILKHQLY